MRSTLVLALLALLAPLAVLAQQDGEYEAALAKVGIVQQFTDVNPIWSPDGKWIAFTRTVPPNAGKLPYIRAGIVPSDATADTKPVFVYNMEPVAWLPDSSGVIAFNRAPQGSKTIVPDLWVIDRQDPKKVTFFMHVGNPSLFQYSPDREKIMLVEPRGANMTEVLVGPKDGEPRTLYAVRDNEKFIQAGWTDKSDAVWVIVEVPIAVETMAVGTPIAAEALVPPPVSIMRSSEESMMEGSDMGPGMEPGMEGSGMEGMNLPPPEPTTKKVLYMLATDGSSKRKIAEGVEFAAWSPTEPLILMQRRDIKVVKVETTMMDMGGSGMEGMGPSYQQVITDYMVLRKPEDSQAQEKKLPGQALAVSGGRWSPTGVMVSGQAPAERHVFALNPKSGPVLEVAQDFDTEAKDPRSVCWSPDGTKLVYSGLLGKTRGADRYITHGLLIRDLQTGEQRMLTENTSKYEPPKPTSMYEGSSMP
jgi:hypothetical protein